MFRNKKAFFTLEEAVIFGFAVGLLIFTFFIVRDIYAGIVGEEDDGSLVNFDKLDFKIQELLKNNAKLAYSQINYFLGDGRVVIGYNKKWDSQENLYIIGLKIEKPSFCGERACLCIFKIDKKGSALGGEPAKPCIKLGKVTYFLKDIDMAIAYPTERTVAIPFYDSQLPDVFSKEQYKLFILDGGNLNRKSHDIYIEKYENPNGEVIFYLAPINDATRDKINKRKAYIDTVNSQ